MWRRIKALHTNLSGPDFLIIGAQRSGTTSLFHYLGHHPRVKLPIIKEIHYFDLQFYRSTNWYFAHFPQSHKSQFTITGEASPYYLFHTDVPYRVAELLPNVRLIILLRDPVARAYSHYTHNCHLGLESRGLDEAINADMNAILMGKSISLATPYSHRHHTYVARGVYIEQLKRWYQYFSKDQILCLNSTNLFQSSPQTLHRVIEFLHLDATELPQVNFIQHNRSNLDGTLESMPQHIVQKLAGFYLPYNQQIATEYNLEIRNWIGYQE